MALTSLSHGIVTMFGYVFNDMMMTYHYVKADVNAVNTACHAALCGGPKAEGRLPSACGAAPAAPRPNDRLCQKMRE